MDSYPGDLLAGVFPLVLAVNATLEKSGEETKDESPNQDDGADTGGVVNEKNEGDEASSTRSAFDRFLDSMAASLVDQNNSNANRQSNARFVSPDAFSFFLGGDDDESSDEEDPSVENSPSTSRRLRVSLTMPRGLRSSANSRTSSTSSTPTAYARSLDAEGFFQRARINAVSTRHGFPPSKDPEGNENRTTRLSTARSAMSMSPTKGNALRLKGVLDEHPIDGILPQGWLEKHVHALPSVLLVVTTLQLNDADSQEKQDELLLETVDHLKESLASKRQCHIRLICLTEFPKDSSSVTTQVEEWKTRIHTESELQVSLLNIPEDFVLAAAGPGSSSPSAIKQLQTTIKDASSKYYQNQCRRVKRKLSLVGHDQQPNLLPLAIRYCFKAGIFYEFQMKHEKSLRYLSAAYRHLQSYYQHLQGRLQLSVDSVMTTKAVVNPQGDDEIEATLAEETPTSPETKELTGVEVSLVDEDDSEGGVRVESSLPDPPIDVRSYFTDMQHPPDMLHQCRSVADWLNFKLIQAGFQSASFSQSEDGVIAASAQWRRHSQVFLKRDDVRNPSWNYWAFVAQQRHVMSQLVERYTPNDLSSLSGLAKDEVMMRCSTWRNYAAAAEAMLRLGVEVRKALQEHQDEATTNTSDTEQSSLRGRFVGSFDSEGLGPRLEEQAKINHTDVALDMLQRAITCFEKDAEESVKGEEEESLESYCRRGSRLYYNAGGIFLGKGQYQEAITHLEKAVKFAAGWSGLELAIRRMLIECYDKHPSQESPTNEKTEIVASMILDSNFNADMHSRNLRRALSNFSSLSGGETLKWNLDCIDELESSLPFSFAVTFPMSTHATAGDAVAASVMIRSNLDYAIHINSVTLLSMAGAVLVPPNVLLSAENANEGSDGGIILQGKKSILMSVQIDLPKDIDNIATDESGNGGEKQGTAGKGSFAKSARPRTAGITSAAGARLMSEKFLGKEPKDKNAQWSLKCLGGKPLRCDGIRLVFYPVHVAKGAAASGGEVAKRNLIELTIEKKKPKTAANIKRTPFEEDNYIASAWLRPKRLPLIRGPRCLRVLNPMPHMFVTNLTDSLTSGKAWEGTVNRILLKLRAGSSEICQDLRYKLSCSSMLLLKDGTRKHLPKDDAMGSPEDTKTDEFDLKSVRLPILVTRDPGLAGSPSTEPHFELPDDWKPVGSGQAMSDEQYFKTTTLQPGEETYLVFDLYRPPPKLPELDRVDENGSKKNADDNFCDNDLCQTDFDLKITYRQARPSAQQGRARRRRKPAASSGNQGPDATSDTDTVCLDYSGSVLWDSPVSAEFQPAAGLHKAHPSGSRHPSNSLQNDRSTEVRDTKQSLPSDKETALVDGESVSVRAVLTAKDASLDLKTILKNVWFEDGSSSLGMDQSPCSLRLVSSNPESSRLLTPRSDDPSKEIGHGTKLSVVYTVETLMKNEFKLGSASSSLGVLCVDWSPVPLPIPEEVRGSVDAFNHNVDAHGPLVLRKAPTMRFRGPPFYIESAPFEISMSLQPPSPRMAVPFELQYKIKNKTSMHQSLSVTTKDGAPDDSGTGSVLISGVVKGQMRLAPFEEQPITLTAVALKSGKVVLPVVAVSCARYKTWVVRSPDSDRTIFVFP